MTLTASNHDDPSYDEIFSISFNGSLNDISWLCTDEKVSFYMRILDYPINFCNKIHWIFMAFFLNVFPRWICNFLVFHKNSMFMSQSTTRHNLRLIQGLKITKRTTCRKSKTPQHFFFASLINQTMVFIFFLTSPISFHISAYYTDTTILQLMLTCWMRL